jgi:hypothetical protein
LDTAWHAGNAKGNASSIGIECRPEGSDGDYATIAELIRFLRDTYGSDLPLIPHRYWQSTACPGTYDLARLNNMANALNPVTPKPIPPTVPQETDMKLEYVADRINTKVSLAANTSVTLKDGKDDWNLAADGLGLGYYDCDVFVRGVGLKDGESITVQPFIVAGSKRSGYFPQEIHGSTDGKFDGNIRFKTPLLSTARVEIDIKTSGTGVVVQSYGADKYVFVK